MKPRHEDSVPLPDYWHEQPASWASGTSHRGWHHPRNEDSMALSATTTPGSFAAAIVCDGVSLSEWSDLAAISATTYGLPVLTDGGPFGGHPVTGTVTQRSTEWVQRLRRAASVADHAIAETTSAAPDHAQAPSCTFAAVIVDGPLIVTGWVGDSRVYWIPDTGEPAQLTRDDSHAQELMRRGTPRALAESSPEAHTLTRWLGADSPDPGAHTSMMVAPSSGWVVVCTDGLWNYCSHPRDIARVVHQYDAPLSDDASHLSQTLVTWALDQGGHDNITTVAIRVMAIASVVSQK